MTVTVITDSAAGMDGETASSHGIVVVPMRVVVGGRSYVDGTLTNAELIDRFDEGVSTSSAPPGAFAEVFGQIEGDIVMLTVSSVLSSVYEAAVIAAAGFGERVRVLDSGTAAGGQALAAIHAAKVAAAGGTLDQVVAAAFHASERMQLIAAFETLEYLIRGGRLNGRMGRVAQRLGMRPIIELPYRRKVRRLRPAFSARAAEDRMISALLRTRLEGVPLHLAALHVEALSAAQNLLRRVVAEVRPATAIIAQFGAVMAAHTGPGLTGLCWWWEEQESKACRGQATVRELRRRRRRGPRRCRPPQRHLPPCAG